MLTMELGVTGGLRRLGGVAVHGGFSGLGVLWLSLVVVRGHGAVGLSWGVVGVIQGGWWLWSEGW